MVPKLTKKEQEKQINKEVIISIFVYLGYFAFWILTGFGLGSQDPSQYVMIAGLPLWFVLSCIVGPILFCVVTAVLSKFVFKNFSLEETVDEGVEVK